MNSKWRLRSEEINSPDQSRTASPSAEEVVTLLPCSERPVRWRESAFQGQDPPAPTATPTATATTSTLQSLP